ncbi:MAG: Rrf2 family transcriptional regulator [Deltaproteobacteria bacterium]|nr:MAG: Rrf2 family transcriptional regulator [Deltaproteobacteria bacterium]
MRLSRRARYALRMMVALFRMGGEERRVSLQKIAGRASLPYRYLEQLSSSLRAAGLLDGLTGKNGGYKLSRRAKDITVGDIVEAVIGPIRIVECLGNDETCQRTDTCECRRLYMEINRGISEVLARYSLEDLSNGLSSQKKLPAI